MELSAALDTLQAFIVTYGLRLIGAVAIFILGRIAARTLSNLAKAALERTKTEAALVSFLTSLTYWAIFAFAVVAALGQLGIQTASFVAVLGAAGLALGLALEGSLANFAAGVLILLFKPFTTKQFVEVAGATGWVEEIQIFSTMILTLDNKTVIVPNSQITSSNIVNYSKKGFVRLDMVFGIGYSDDLLKAKGILQEIINHHELVLEDPKPSVSVLALADSSVNFAVRPYVKIEDYWRVHFDVHEQVKLQFDEQGVSIPFPQQDVHLFSQN
ncbi:MAG: mechanosensitive ion channel [Chloroflexi bacterium]|nr:mechanosensitive ion channel [Chloroflexota bacterium]